MTQINPNINNPYIAQQPIYRADAIAINPQNQQTQQVQLPDIYYYPTTAEEPQGIKETIKKADMMQLVTPWIENPIITGLTTLGVFKGFDYLSKNFGGEYNTSLVGKAANWGDRVANSQFVQSDKSQRVIKSAQSIWSKTKNFANNNRVLSAILNTPARPDWDMPRSEMQSMQARNVQDFKEFASKIGLGNEGKMKLVNLGIDKNETEATLKFFNVQKLSGVSDEKITNFVRLKRLGLNDSAIKSCVDDSAKVEAEILKAMKLSKAEFDEIMKDTTGKTAKKLEAALANAQGKLKASGGNIKWLGKFQPLSRTMTGEQYFNRLHSISSAKSSLGRMSAKSMQILHKMATFGGGKLGLLIFMIPSIINTIKNTQKADKDSKVGTIANGLLTATTWVVTFPLGVKALFHLAGLKNIGNSKENVAKIREITDTFNNSAKSNKFATKAEFDTARKAAKDAIKALKPKDGNLLEKILRKAGSFLDIGNGNLAGRNIFQKLPNFGKNVIGVPMRFLLGMMVFVPFFDKIIEKCSTAIFGKHYDEMKEEEYKDNKKKQKEFTKQDLQNRMLEVQAAKLNAQNNVAPIEQPQAIEQNAPVIPQEVQATAPKAGQTADSYNYIPNPNPAINHFETVKRDNYTYMPSQENVLNPHNGIQPSKYIPSQLGANLTKTFDNSGLQDALKRADSAEKRAVQVLSGKFAGYQN